MVCIDQDDGQKGVVNSDVSQSFRLVGAHLGMPRQYAVESGRVQEFCDFARIPRQGEAIVYAGNVLQQACMEVAIRGVTVNDQQATGVIKCH
jgi:hypothetical protein